jgi:hypothetical protein
VSGNSWAWWSQCSRNLPRGVYKRNFETTAVTAPTASKNGPEPKPGSKPNKKGYVMRVQANRYRQYTSQINRPLPDAAATIETLLRMDLARNMGRGGRGHEPGAAALPIPRTEKKGAAAPPASCLIMVDACLIRDLRIRNQCCRNYKLLSYNILHIVASAPWAPNGPQMGKTPLSIRRSSQSVSAIQQISS